MSTILKALRRLEEDNARGASSRPLREEVASGPAETPRRRGLMWLPAAAQLVGAGIGASIWWVWPYERGSELARAADATRPAATPSPVVVTPPVVAPPEPAAGAAPLEAGALTPASPASPPGSDAEAAKIGASDAEGARTGLPEDAFASGVEVVQRPRATPRIESPPVPAEARVIADPPRVAAESPALVAKRSRAPAPKRAEAVAPAKPEAPAAEREVAASAPALAPAPKARESDAAVRVTRTQWHPDAGRRSADLELAGKSQNVHEGDVVGEYVVTEIRPSGVVLTRDGERIERSIGK